MEVIGDIYVYPVDMKGHGKAMCRPCADGYTVYIDVSLSREQRIAEFYHEASHINNDFQKDSVQLIEAYAHR